MADLEVVNQLTKIKERKIAVTPSKYTNNNTSRVFAYFMHTNA